MILKELCQWGKNAYQYPEVYSTSSMPPVSFKRGLGSLRDIETFYSSLTFWWVNFSSALFGIAIVASFWDVDKSNLAFLTEFVLFSTPLEYDCKTCTVYCPLLISINKINSSQHLARKYSRIFVFGHYLFREANSFPLATLWENCSLLETDVRRQISVYIFGPNGGYCVYYPSNLFSADGFENWGIYK